MRVALLAVLALCACGPEAMKVQPPQDVRVPVPAADAQYWDIVGGEQTIPAGMSKMFCTYLQYTGPESAFNNMVMLQGKWGHHVILLGAKEPKAPGTIEDCTDPKDMGKYNVFSFLGDELPAGYGTALHSQVQLVIQSHYVNTSDHDILVRDVIRVHLVDPAAVTHWGAAVVNNNMIFSVPPMSLPTPVTIDCVVPSDMDIMMLAGHMHEYGSSFETLAGPDTAHLTSVYKVDQWRPDYRDSPPIKMMYTQPMHWAAGTVIRTVCSWTNTTDHALKFPEEMCDSVGYGDGIDAPWQCNVAPPM